MPNKKKTIVIDEQSPFLELWHHVATKLENIRQKEAYMQKDNMQLGMLINND